MYGRDDPKPGNFSPRYASTQDYIDIVNKVTGRDMRWFFKVYLYDAALPRLEINHHGTALDLHWVTEHGEDFPMPVEVQVGQTFQTVSMDAHGDGHMTVPADSLLIVDPHSKLLREMPHIEAYQEWMKQHKSKRSP